MKFKLPGRLSSKKAGGAMKKPGFGGGVKAGFGTASKPKSGGVIWSGLSSSMDSNPHRGMLIRQQNASLAAEKGKYGSVRPKPSTVTPRKVAARAATAARGGSRTAAKRISKRH